MMNPQCYICGCPCRDADGTRGRMILYRYTRAARSPGTSRTARRWVRACRNCVETERQMLSDDPDERDDDAMSAGWWT